MRTDKFGREVAPARRGQVTFSRNMRAYLSGVATGAGLCLGIWPPLPQINSLTGAATLIEQAPDDLLARFQEETQLASSIAANTIFVQREAIELLQQKWNKLDETMEKALHLSWRRFTSTSPRMLRKA